MKAHVCLLAVLLFSCQSGVTQQAGTPAASPQHGSTGAAPEPNTLLDGTPIRLRLTENLSSETNKTNDDVPFEVIDEIDVMGVPVIAKGATALGTVTEAEPKRRMGRGGKLNVVLNSVRLVDGEKAQIAASKDSKGGGHIGVMTTAMVATAVVFFPAAPLFLFMHGKPVNIPKGTEITAFVQGDMKLDMSKMVVPGSVPAPIAPGGAAVAPVMASLTVDSSVAGADIEVDGSFVGNTPSTVSVTPGTHTITVKKKGYEDWSRTMNVAGSSVHLSADLDAVPVAK